MIADKLAAVNMTTYNLYWHPWHRGGPVWLMTDTEAAQRKVTINTEKPEAERPLRNQLFQKVQGTLPEALAARDKALAARDKAWAARDKAWAARVKALAARVKALAARDKALAARDKAWAARVNALAACDKALADNMPAIMALHAVECGCRWTPEGPNIFEDERP